MKCLICRNEGSVAPSGGFERKVILGSEERPTVVKFAFYTEEGEPLPLCKEHIDLVLFSAIQRPVDLND